MIYFYALLISFFWGIIPIIYKVLLHHLNNVTVMAITTVFYSIFLILLVFYNRDIVIKDLNKITNHEYLWILITTFFGVFLANFLYYYVLKKGEPAILTALMYSCPLFTLFAAHYFLKDKIKTNGIIGIIFIVLGVIFISMNK